MKSISLVIALYNQVDYTRRCIESIMACTPHPYELILVDNASVDGTADYVGGLPATLIRNDTNLGCAKAWNQGIRASRGEAIGILNNDIVVTPGIANLIRENKVFRITSAIQTGAKHGMKLLDDHIFEHWKGGLVTKEDAISKCNQPDELSRRFAAAERGIFDDKPEGVEEEQYA